MAQVKDALVWLDMEMTGLDPQKDKVIELAMVVTDSELEVIAEAPVWAIHQPDRILDNLDEWNQKHHNKSGLIERVRASRLSARAVQKAALEFLHPIVAKGKSPMCGNSICQDRRFMAKHMPGLEAWFHYRNLDVSTIKELCKRWAPQVSASFKKKGKHQALADIHESIDELRYYREFFLRY